MQAGYDVIGDVHGSVASLEGLLSKLGYRQAGGHGTWGHADRVAVFLGDLIDRGPGQRRTIELVRAMVDAGNAHVVLGNHEFNAIGYATRRQDPPHDHLRRRTRKNFSQHQQFLTEYAVDSREHGEVVEWFKTLPLWLELPGLRVIHACWSNEHVSRLRAAHGGAGLPDGRPLEDLFDENHALYEAVEIVLKGPEVEVKDEFHYLDKDKHPRTKARYAWWVSGEDTYRNRAVFVPGSLRPDGSEHTGFDDSKITTPPVQPYTDEVPVIVGHYWQQDTPAVLSERVACVDYSAVKGGDLVAYRFDGEAALDNDKLVGFPGD